MSFDPVDPTVLRARKRLGTVLRNKWQLTALLGIGGMAAVYIATHRNGSRIAVKMLHPELSLDESIRSRFLREAYVSNSVGHRGAVQVIDDDLADDGAAFLVMELLEGETLEARRLKHGGVLASAEVLSLTDQLLDVLVAAHAKGIVHRDLKPDNIFLTVDGVVKVLDFGIARLREASTEGNATRTGAAMGTPSYMPPEQARGRWGEVDGRTDLWAVGATMFTLLTGRMVHEAATVNEQLLAAMTIPAPSLSAFGPFASQLVLVTDKALAFDKTNRWSDAGSMQDAVREAYHALVGGEEPAVAKMTIAMSPSPMSVNAPASPVTTPTEALVTTGGALIRGRTGVGFGRPTGLLRRRMIIPVLAAMILGAAVAVSVLATRTGTVTSGAEAASVSSSAGAAAPAGPLPSASTQERSESAPVDISSLPSATTSKDMPPKEHGPAATVAVKTPGGPAVDAGRKADPPRSRDELMDKWK